MTLGLKDAERSKLVVYLNGFHGYPFLVGQLGSAKNDQLSIVNYLLNTL